MKENKKKVPVILSLIIIIQLIITGYVFFNLKEGNHSDEIWSYGLANSYYKPFVYLQPEVNIEKATAEDVDNIHQWISGDVFKDYITVQKSERFSYGSVYSNQTYDHHPPLYYMLLHTVCSFFPDKFSFAYGFFLNCIFLIITQIYLFRLCRSITESDKASLLACLFYGASTGAMQTFIFIRQYSLLTMLGIIFLYYSSLLYKDLSLKKQLPPVLISAFLMFSTHYYGIVFVGAFTACMCIYLIIKKKFKKMVIYGFSTLFTLLLFFLAYPAGFRQITESETKGNEFSYDFVTQFRLLCGLITRYLYGLKLEIFKTGNTSYVISVIILLIAFSIPLCFLFRKEEWFRNFKSKTKSQFKHFIKWIPSANYTPVFAAAAAFALMLATDATSNLLTMGMFAIRYEFIVFPVFAFITIVFVYNTVKALFKKEVIACITTFTLIIVFSLLQFRFVNNNSFFLFKHYPDKSACELLKGKNCLMIADKKCEWLLTCFSNYCMESDHFFFSTLDSLEEDVKTIKESGITVDYVLCNNLGLSEEEQKMLAKWTGDDKKPKNKFREELNAANEQKIAEEGTDLIIGELNDNKGIRFIGNICIINGYVHMFAMNQN